MYGGMFVSKTPINLTEASSISGFDIQGEGEFYALFSIGSGWGRISDDGTAIQTTNIQSPTFDDVVKSGNSLEELLAYDNVSALANKKVNIAIVAGSNDAPPKFKFGIKAEKESVLKTEVIESEEYDIRGDIQSIEGDSTDNVTIEVSGYKNGKWLSYVPLNKASTNYEKVKFRATLTVDEVGQKAVFNSVTLKAHPNDAVIPSKEVAIYTTRPVKDAKIYVVGNNKGVVRAFCSQTTPAQWKEIERITENSFDKANGMLKLTLTQDGEATPEIEGYVIQE